VEMGNIEELANKIYDLLNDEEKQKEYIRKMKIRRRDFTVEKSVSEFIDMIENV